MTLTITPTTLSGPITPPPSKSQAHRLLIAAALAQGESVIRNVAYSQDIQATMACLEELGAEFQREGNAVTVRGMGASHRSPDRRIALPHLDCGESGSTLRFLIPIALAVRGGGVFTGRGRLMERPQTPYFDLFEEKGIFYAQKDGVLTVQGELRPGEYRLPGNVSSQFITGLLYALPLLAGDSKIMLTTSLESAGYVTMTRQAQETFGVRSQWARRDEASLALPPEGGTLLVPGMQTYGAARTAVEADWSQAAFWLAAQAMGNPVTVEGMDPNSTQGDRVFPHWVRMVRGEPPKGGVTAPIWGSADRIVPPAKEDRGGCAVSIDVSPSPDLVPPLAAMGAVINGVLRIKNAARLRLKESDRLSTVREELCKLGASVEEGPDSLTIVGQDRLPGGVPVDAHNDHRIAMMLAIAATRCQKPVTLTGAESVAKSYPNFWEEYARLGGQLETQ